MVYFKKQKSIRDIITTRVLSIYYTKPIWYLHVRFIEDKDS